MLTTLGARALSGLAVIAGVATLTFFLLHLAPGDPVERLVGPRATPAESAALRHTLELDRPLVTQYTAWAGRFVRGDWGRSVATGGAVCTRLGDAWPATVLLVGLSLLLSYPAGLLVGAAQAAQPGSRADTAVSVVSVALYAMPGYWLALMLVMLFTYGARALPAFGAAGLDADLLRGGARFADRLRHLALPLATLTLIGVGGVARFVRGAMLDVAAQPYITTARAKGLTPIAVSLRHTLRNALAPVLTLLGLSLPALFSGAVFVEAVFAWPGVGRVLVEAVQGRDYPVVMAATTVSAALVVTGNVLADLLAVLADPRIRPEGRGA